MRSLRRADGPELPSSVGLRGVRAGRRPVSRGGGWRLATITWWGHATVTVEDSGVRVLTDPLFPRRLAHLRRRAGAVPPADAARADLVLVSHLHADHLHVPSLARLAPGTRVLVPRGARRAVP